MPVKNYGFCAGSYIQTRGGCRLKRRKLEVARVPTKEQKSRIVGVMEMQLAVYDHVSFWSWRMLFLNDSRNT